MYRYRHCSLINLGKSLNQKRQTPKKDLPLLKSDITNSAFIKTGKNVFQLEYEEREFQIACRIDTIIKTVKIQIPTQHKTPLYQV